MSSKSPQKKKAKSKGPAPSYLRDNRLSQDGDRHPENRSRTEQPTARRPTKSAAPAADVEVVEIDSDPPTVRASCPDLYSGGEFSRQVLVVFKSLLNKNQHADNPHTHNKSFFNNITDKLIDHAPQMLKKAHSVDVAKGFSGNNSLTSLLRKAIPPRVPKAVSKAKMVDIFTAVWQVLRLIIYKTEGAFNRQLLHDLEDYIGLMERTESTAKASHEEDRAKKEHAKSIKISAAEARLGYLQDGAKKPPPQFSKCAKCGMDGCVHEPPSNVTNHQQNKVTTREWRAHNNWIEEYINKERDDPFMLNGKIITKPLPPPTLKDELLVCCAAKMTHSAAGGYQCATCSDRSCAMCKNMCRFVSYKR